MSQSARLRLADVRAVYTTVAECRDLGDDAFAWRRHFARSTGRLIGADAAMVGEMGALRAGQPRNIGALNVAVQDGIDLSPWAVAYRELVAGRLGERGVIEACMAWAGQTGLEASTAEMIGERAWYRSLSFELYYQVAGFDANLFSFHPAPGVADEFSGIILSRLAGRRPFSAREVQVLHELHTALAGLLGGPLARFREPCPSQLGPRQRQVLRCLLEGDGDKQVAIRLGISRFTVNQHTKVIYRHFGVAGRAELLARWVRRGWGAGGRWDPERPSADPT